MNRLSNCMCRLGIKVSVTQSEIYDVSKIGTLFLQTHVVSHLPNLGFGVQPEILDQYGVQTKTLLGFGFYSLFGFGFPIACPWFFGASNIQLGQREKVWQNQVLNI